MNNKVRCFIILIGLLISVAVKSQTYEFFQTKNYHNQLRLNTKTGEVYQVQDDGGSWIICSHITPSSTTPYRYWLYPTRNMWTWILVDLFTGKIWQCQYSVESSDGQFAIPINSQILSYTEHSKFEVKPMVSMYQFYLINNDTGEMWQFQWSTDSNDGYRWIKKIN